MAYQPLYAEVEDTNAVRHTTSIRSRVEWINLYLNSHFGKVFQIDARSKGSYNGEKPKDTYEAEQKIKQFKEAGNEKKVKLWEQKLKERQEQNAEWEKQEYCSVFIDLRTNPKFKFNINGLEITPSELRALSENREELKSFLSKIPVMNELDN